MNDSRPAAVQKAESLYKYASDQGASIKSFCLAISAQEGLELLDWWANSNTDERFLADLADAHISGDPFPVLEHFNLHGLAIVRKADLH